MCASLEVRLSTESGSMNIAVFTNPNGISSSQSPCFHDPDVNTPQW